MSKYVISPSAIKDLNAIADYYLTTNVAAGEKLFEDFNNKCKKLAQFPNMGRSYSYPTTKTLSRGTFTLKGDDFNLVNLPSKLLRYRFLLCT